MTRFGWLVASGVVIAALGIALLLWGFARQSAPRLEDDNLTPVVDYSSLNIHANGEYGFTVQYPASAGVEDTFPEGEPSWRANVSDPGTLIVRFTTAGGEVRIGASSDANALESCEEAGPSETQGEPVEFGGTAWQVFTFDELGTEDERRVTSYRTVHDGQCFALEAYEPYTPPANVLPTEEAAYIVRSFSFAR